MSTVLIGKALDEIEDARTQLYCSYCRDALPEHLQDEQPCALCGEFSFSLELVSVGSANEKKFRVPRPSVLNRDVKPIIGGIVGRKEFDKS